MTTFSCMRPNKDRLEENKRRHQDQLKNLVGKSVVGYHLIIEEVTSVDIENDTVTGVNIRTGEEVTVNWSKITFAER